MKQVRNRGPAPPSRVRILIVDDHSFIREGVRLFLQSHPGLRVTGEVPDGKSLLERLDRKDWDVLVLELVLPDWDGLELIRQIRRREPDRPILALTMLSEENYGVRALRAGADGYLSKGAPVAKFVEAIELLSKGHKYISPVLADRLATGLSEKAPVFPHEALSDREFQVMCRIAAGKSIKEIGRLLALSPKTVSTYRSRILSKMHLKGTAAIIEYVIEHRLLR